MIKKLPEDTIKKIAAGEIILDPASCVKELIENSIDAGAERIEVEIEKGGKERIKVSDDGEGIRYTDLPHSVERFSTSKIEKIEDLKEIKSLGFRGEALASIAEVSFLKIESKHRDEDTGGKLIVEKGEILDITEIARTEGTTVIVEKLFFNLPARRAFLKSDSYEAKKIAELIKTYALIFANIEFILISDGKKIFHFFRETEKERIKNIFKEIDVSSLLEIHHTHPLISIHGFIESPELPERKKPYPIIAINNRPVKYRLIQRAVEDLYKDTFNKNPWFFMKLEIKPELVDVNIHPSKREVKFHDEKFLYDFLTQIIKKNLIADRNKISREITSFRVKESEYSILQESSPYSIKQESPIFWQLKNTYIFAQIKTGFIIIDQHAAHERILYEQILKKERKKQKLLFPVTITLDEYSMEVYLKLKSKLERMGIETRVFGEDTIVIETIPDDSRLTLKEIEELFKEFTEKEDVVENEDEIAKMIACKAAIKSGTPLSQEEMESLINRLFACENPYFCPHGRPTVLKFTIEEIEKKFGRI